MRRRDDPVASKPVLPQVPVVMGPVLVFWLFQGTLLGSRIGNQRPIARIGGHVITAGQIEVSQELAQVHPALKGLEGEALSHAVREMEKAELARLLLRQILSELVKKNGIVVTEEEIQAEYRRQTAFLTEDMKRKIWQTQRALIRALRSWQRAPDQDQRIYDKELKGLISRYAWVFYKGEYGTPAKLQMLERYQGNMQGQLRKGIVRDLAVRKLEQKVAPAPEVNPEEIRKRYAAEYLRVRAWSLVHLCHRDKSRVEQMRSDLMKGAPLEDVIRRYGLESREAGAFAREEVSAQRLMILPGQAVKALERGHITAVTSHPLIGTVKQDGLAAKVHAAEKLWYVTFLERIERAGTAPPIQQVWDSIKERLAAERQEAIWDRWLRAQISDAKIEVLDPAFKDVPSRLLPLVRSPLRIPRRKKRGADAPPPRPPKPTPPAAKKDE